VWLEEGPWWAFALEWLTPRVCDLIPRWRVPFIGRLTVVDEEGEVYSWREWRGDTLHDLFHSFVCDPLVQFANRHIHAKDIPLTWEQGKHIFYADDPEWWDEEERFFEEVRDDERD
jgi:hypothetical protein